MPLEPGTNLGGYQILCLIGSGGMGEVYRARDSRLQREIAIKVLPKHLSEDPEILGRFEQEAAAVAALSHPNILTVHDSGVDHGVVFFVMELLEGESLDSRLKVSPLPWRKAVEIGIAVAEGLSAAHTKGIIHCDIKPGNIFLTSQNVKVLDFGLARWKATNQFSQEELIRWRSSAPPSSDDTMPLDTDVGKVIGTVGYMSPEQVRGWEAGPPSDIFSLGCVLYEMVWGRQAFRRPTVAQTMAAILAEDLPDAMSSSPFAPVELTRIIAHCVEKDPNYRFQSARDLAFALRSVLQDSSRWTPASKRAAKGISSLAVLPFLNSSGDPEVDHLCDGITESIINSMTTLPNLRVVPRAFVFRYKGRDLDPSSVGRELNVGTMLMGRIQQRADVLTVNTELIDVSSESQLWGERYVCPLSDILNLQDDIGDQILAKLKLKVTGAERKRLAKRPTESTEAYELYLKGRYHWNHRTPERLKKALEYYQAALEKDSKYAMAYAGAAECYALFCSFSVLPPHQTCPKAREMALEALRLDPKLAEGHVSLGYVNAFYDYDWNAAEKEFNIAIAQKPTYPTSHHWQGLAYNALGRGDDAIAATGRALALDPLSNSVGTALAYSFFFARRYDEGIAQARSVLEMEPTFGIAYYFMGLCFEQKGMIDQALDCLRKAVSFLDGNPTAAAGYGHALGVAGKRAEALEVIERQLELSKKRYVSNYDVALIYAGLGDAENYFAWLDKACDDRSPWLPFLRSEPRSDPYRRDPRFQKFLKFVRLGAGLSEPSHTGAHSQ